MDYSYKAFNSKQTLRQESPSYNFMKTFQGRSEKQAGSLLCNRALIQSSMEPDRAFINLHMLKSRKFTISLSMQLPLSPLFPLVSSTDSKQSISTSPGLIFICLKKRKNFIYCPKIRPFLFPCFAFLSFLLSTSCNEKSTYAHESTLHTWNYHYISQIKNIKNNIFIINLKQ